MSRRHPMRGSARWLVLACLLSGPIDAVAQAPGRPGVVAPPGRAPAPAAVMSRAQVNALLGPLRLVRPLAPETIDRLFQEGESLYRSQHHQQAFEAFATLLELEPRHIPAWLRVGNLHQQAEREPEAVEAYRRASREAPHTDADLESQGKALLNIALLGLSQLDRAIEDFEAIDVRTALDQDAFGDVREGLARSLAQLRHRILAGRDDRFAPERDPRSAWPRGRRSVHLDEADAPEDEHPGRRRTRDPESRRSAFQEGRRVEPEPPWLPSPAPSDPRAHEPYTVDRWTGRSRRPAGGSTPARSMLVEPLTESPLPAAPAVDVLRGGPAGRGRW